MVNIFSPFLQNNSSPFNKYAFLTTHNSYAINRRRVLTGSPRCTLTNQEDSITHQLNVMLSFLISRTWNEFLFIFVLAPILRKWIAEWGSSSDAGYLWFWRRCMAMPFAWRRMLWFHCIREYFLLLVVKLGQYIGLIGCGKSSYVKVSPLENPLCACLVAIFLGEKVEITQWSFLGRKQKTPLRVWKAILYPLVFFS